MNQLLDRLKEHKRLSLAGAAALVVAVVLVLVFVVAGVGGDDDDNGDSAADNPGVVTNVAGQYSITLPEGYTAAQQGRLTTIKAQDGSATMEIAPGDPGRLEDAASVLYQRVGRNYDTGQQTNLPTGVDAKEINGRQALLYAGGGTNTNGIKIRFLAVTIADQPANWWITIYVPEDSNPEQTLPKVTQIVDTFTPR